MRLVQIFRQEKRKLREFDEVNTDHLQASMKELKVYAVFRPAMELLGSLAMTFLIWVGGGDVLRGAVEFGTLLPRSTTWRCLFRPINDLTEKFNSMQVPWLQPSGSCRSWTLNLGSRDRPAPKSCPACRDELSLRMYGLPVGEEWVLKDASPL